MTDRISCQRGKKGMIQNEELKRWGDARRYTIKATIEGKRGR